MLALVLIDEKLIEIVFKVLRAVTLIPYRGDRSGLIQFLRRARMALTAVIVNSDVGVGFVGC